MFTADSFFDIEQFEHPALFEGNAPVWLALSRLKDYMEGLTYPAWPYTLAPLGAPLTRPLVFHNDAYIDGSSLSIELGDATKGKLTVTKDGMRMDGASVIMAGTVVTGGRLLLGRGVLIESGALIKSPTVIGDQTEVRHGAYLRGHCLVGRRCVVGHTTEMKHSIFLDDAKAGHFAYIGDSILGNRVNLGAGTKLANLRFAKGDVPVKTAEGPVSTGLTKLGAILGDDFQSGCNSVTNPGTVVGKRSILLPNTTSPSGYHLDRSLIRQETEDRRQKKVRNP